MATYRKRPPKVETEGQKLLRRGYYTKTDGECRICLYDKNDNFIKFLDEENC
jgi:hypothetical protein